MTYTSEPPNSSAPKPQTCREESNTMKKPKQYEYSNLCGMSTGQNGDYYLVDDIDPIIEAQAAEIEAMKECVRFLRIAVGFDKDYDEAEDEAKEALARLDAIRGAK
jgi:hypothetical protein